MYADLHCHILPGIDDGAKDLAQSLAMARLAVEDGIKTTVVTPHHLNGVYLNHAADILAALANLREALIAEGIPLKLLPGCELHLVPELPEQLAAGEAMTLGNHGKAVLVELPVHTVPMGADHIIEQILSQGLTPIIAHPERNSQLRQDPELLAEWVSMGCLGQVTAQSCTGMFGPQVQTSAREMISRSLIHIIASDAHRDRRRIPEISKGEAQVARWTNERTARLLAREYPLALADGRNPDLDQLTDALPRYRRSWWQRLVG
ncbi:MAG: protein-tyrosine phosphatase [Wenzhouxiangella sp.]|nr:MAG: protein-tyrosine phosphatase [Wenzhouxiangella sp.]